MKIGLLGDVALFGRFSLKKGEEVYGYLRSAAEKLREYDLVIANLETPFADDESRHGCKSIHLKSTPADVSLLEYLNIGAVNLSNNHMYDYGPDACQRTIDLLHERGIGYFGVEGHRLPFERDGTRLLIHGYCCFSTNPLGLTTGRGTGRLEALDVARVMSAIEQARDQGYVSIVSVHWGQEHVHLPHWDHVRLARRMADHAVCVIHGHHPHVLQGIEEVGESLIAYSLGNFCFDDLYSSKSATPLLRQSERNRESVIWSVQLDRNRIVDSWIVPLYQGKHELVVGAEGVEDRVAGYSRSLVEQSVGSYVKTRKGMLQRYAAKRRATRDREWYLKRMGPESLCKLLVGVRNRIRYRRSVGRYF